MLFQRVFTAFFFFGGEGITSRVPEGASWHTQIRIIQGGFNNEVVYKYVSRV